MKSLPFNSVVKAVPVPVTFAELLVNAIVPADMLFSGHKKTRRSVLMCRNNIPNERIR